MCKSNEFTRFGLTEDFNMSIAEQIRQEQDTKEMTRRAIKILESIGENVDDLKMEFLEAYGEEV